MLQNTDKAKIYYLATGRVVADEESLGEFRRWWQEHFVEPQSGRDAPPPKEPS